jgi:hypothetical protein
MLRRLIGRDALPSLPTTIIYVYFYTNDNRQDNKNVLLIRLTTKGVLMVYFIYIKITKISISIIF